MHEKVLEYMKYNRTVRDPFNIPNDISGTKTVYLGRKVDWTYEAEGLYNGCEMVQLPFEPDQGVGISSIQLEEGRV